MSSGLKRIIKKLFRIVAWVLGCIVLLLVAIALLIQLPPVQGWLTQKAVSFLQQKIGTEVALEGIHIAFPKSIVLEGFYMEDQKGDTLLYAGKLSVDTDLWALTRNEIQLNDVVLENTLASVSRPEYDSAFNFTYILNAFAGDSTAVPDTLEQKGWNITLETLELEKVRLHLDDRLQGNFANISLGHFTLEMRSFDLENNSFEVENILLENSIASFRQSKLPVPTPKTEVKEDSAAAVVFSMEDLEVRNVKLQYEQSVLGRTARLDLGEVQLLPEKIDLANQDIALNKFVLKNTFVAYHQADADTVIRPAQPTYPTDSPATSRPWKVTLGELTLADNSIQYYDFTKPSVRGAVDFNHLWLTGFSVDARNIAYAGKNIHAELNNLSLREQSGFAVQSFRGKVDISNTQAQLEDFLLLTGNSRLQLHATAVFKSLDDIASTYADTRITSDINNSYVNVRDILYFNPAFLDSLPLSLSPRTNLELDAAVRGTVGNLDIGHLVFQTLSDTYLKTSGRISGLPDSKKLRMDITLDKFHTTRHDLETILPDTLLPDSLQLPGWINVQARYKGTMQKAEFSTLLTSDAGSIDAKGNMNLDSASALRGIDITLNVNDLDAGTILGKPDSVMGTLTMRADAHVNGLSPDEMNGTLHALVNHFDFQGYNYQDLKLDGNIRNRVATVNASMSNRNLDFTLDADYVFSGDVPRYDFTFDLKNADFQALNLSSSPIRARGTLDVNMATADFKVLNGNVGIRKVAVFNGDDLYAVDSLLFASIDQEGRSEINIDSDLLQARFEGSINIFGLPGVLREYFNSYYSLHDSLEVKDSPPQHFKFDVQLKNTDLLTDLLVPKLTTFDPGPMHGEFDSRSNKLDIKLEIDNIQYSNIGIKSLVLSTNSDTAALRYNLMIDKIMIDSTKIDGLEFNGTAANNSIKTNLIIFDSADREKYVLAGTLLNRENIFEFKLSPSDIMLNYQNWSVPADNYLLFGGEKLVAHNVELTNLREKIIIESRPQPGTPISIGFRELNLEYLTSMVAEERPASGLLHGDIHLFPGKEAMTFTSDLGIDDFRIKDIPWGNVSLKVEQTVRNRFNVNFALTGNENNVTLDGYYLGGESPSMDLTARVGSFSLGSLQPLLVDQVQDLKGTLKGDIHVGGTTDRPDIDGGLLVSNTAFFSNYLRTKFSIDNESISFIDEGISFNAFEVADQNNNKARLNGTILTRTYRDFKFNLDLFTDHFRLFNTTAKDNDLFYGKVDVEATVKIRGNLTTPVINAEIGMSDGSNLTYVVPQSEGAALEAEGIVKFVDRSFEGDPFMKRIEPEVSDTVKSTFRGIDLTARIELTDKETFTVIIDPLTQDQLTVRGNSTLTLQVDPTGDINLTGRYEIEDGTYNLSFYKFVKREFNIDKGSSITWLGDPLNAQMDISAIYKVETAPIELFSNQLTGADANEVNQYKQQLPFMVYLNLEGELLQPEISFKLEMPIEERGAFGGNVYARLQDINTRESDLNKQVFALLILKRFISDDPFENRGGGGLESTARSSVSKILSEQLNRLSQNIKGVELSFDIKSYEDYSSGQAQGQTELQLGVSKSLFNDRLVVKLSGNIDIEGENSNRDATDYIGDLALEYKITPDGRFRITGFRNSDYDMIDGELTETGAGLIYVKDYNSLSELFKANAEKKN